MWERDYNPNSVCRGGNGKLGGTTERTRPSPGSLEGFLEEVALIWSLYRPHTAQIICPTHSKLKIEKDCKILNRLIDIIIVCCNVLVGMQ